MGQLTDVAIYRLWTKTIEGRRYLRHSKWNELLTVINQVGVHTVLEFGSGVSTLLFNNQGCEVVSFETDAAYIEQVKDLLPPGHKVTFVIWNNRSLPYPLGTKFDLTLVDGIMPRDVQTQVAIKHSKVVAVDDVTPNILKRRYLRPLTSYQRLNDEIRKLAIFKII